MTDDAATKLGAVNLVLTRRLMTRAIALADEWELQTAQGISTALLFRVERLLASIMTLVPADQHPTAVRLLFRSVWETSVDVRYLVKNGDAAAHRFRRDGLRRDVEMLAGIRSEVQSRNGATLVVESRMIESINHRLNVVGLAAEDVKANLDRWPTVKVRIQDVGQERVYSAFAILAQDVHGTMASLLYPLEDPEVPFNLMALVVLDAVRDYVSGYFPADGELLSAVNEHWSRVNAYELETGGFHAAQPDNE